MVKLLTGVILSFLVGCTSLGLAPAKSFPDQLAYAYGVHTAVLQTASAGLSDKSLSQIDGNIVLRIADQSRQLLDSAKAISDSGGDLKNAQSKLALATALLSQVQTFLQSHGR